MSEWFRWQSGETARIVIARDVGFLNALVNTFLFVLVVAPSRRASPSPWRC